MMRQRILPVYCSYWQQIVIMNYHNEFTKLEPVYWTLIMLQGLHGLVLKLEEFLRGERIRTSLLRDIGANLGDIVWESTELHEDLGYLEGALRSLYQEKKSDKLEKLDPLLLLNLVFGFQFKQENSTSMP